MTVQSLKVLICDDSMLVRKKLTSALKNLGISEIFEAADGEMAVATYKANSPDLTLMDIVMPKLDGVDALKEILSANPHAKVVMASSVGTQENLRDAINAGAFDFLQKPISDKQLAALIEKICK